MYDSKRFLLQLNEAVTEFGCQRTGISRQKRKKPMFSPNLSENLYRGSWPHFPAHGLGRYRISHLSGNTIKYDMHRVTVLKGWQAAEIAQVSSGNSRFTSTVPNAAGVSRLAMVKPAKVAQQHRLRERRPCMGFHFNFLGGGIFCGSGEY
jgi:hypothetical protein